MTDKLGLLSIMDKIWFLIFSFYIKPIFFSSNKNILFCKVILLYCGGKIFFFMNYPKGERFPAIYITLGPRTALFLGQQKQSTN